MLSAELAQRVVKVKKKKSFEHTILKGALTHKEPIITVADNILKLKCQALFKTKKMKIDCSQLQF